MSLRREIHKEFSFLKNKVSTPNLPTEPILSYELSLDEKRGSHDTSCLGSNGAIWLSISCKLFKIIFDKYEVVRWKKKSIAFLCSSWGLFMLKKKAKRLKRKLNKSCDRSLC